MSDEQQADPVTDTPTDETQPGAENVESEATASNDAVDPEPADDADQFPRDYVERLRRESAGYRDKAKTAEARTDELARQLFTARVAATGLLADARDLPFDPAWLDNETELRGAIAALLDDRPHLKARTVSGDVGQGRRDSAPAQVNLIGLLRGER